MPKRQRPASGGGGSSTNLASCVVATLFLILIVIVILILFFTMFKPKDPQISVKAVQVPSFSIFNNTVNFTFSQYVSVKNPNRAAFSHYDSTLQLLYGGSQVGFMFIPAGQILSGHTKHMSASFSVQSFPLSSSSSSPDSSVVVSPSDSLKNIYYRVGPTMEIESRIQMVGGVRVLQVFTHHVEARVGCRVAVSVTDGSVLGFHCQLVS